MHYDIENLAVSTHLFNRLLTNWEFLYQIHNNSSEMGYVGIC